MTGFSPSGGLATLTWFNEADLGSLTLRLTGSLRGASTRRLLPAPSASLHAGRSVGMMNTFQFISLVGGAGAPEGNEGSEGLPQLVRIGMFLCLLRYLLLKRSDSARPARTRRVNWVVPYLLGLSVNGADGISDIEGKAATGSGERAGKASEFQIRGELTSAFPRRVFGKRDRRAKDPKSDRA
jgi:hypothetical protein